MIKDKALQRLIAKMLFYFLFAMALLLSVTVEGGNEHFYTVNTIMYYIAGYPKEAMWKNDEGMSSADEEISCPRLEVLTGIIIIIII